MELQLPESLRRFLIEGQISAIQRRREAVLADPERHKKTLEFPEGATMNYRFFRVTKAGPEVRYCWSTGRNLAGYFLGWRETIRRDGTGKRDMWLASKRRSVVKGYALQRRNAHQRKVGGR